MYEILYIPFVIYAIIRTVHPQYPVSLLQICAGAELANTGGYLPTGILIFCKHRRARSSSPRINKVRQLYVWING